MGLRSDTQDREAAIRGLIAEITPEVFDDDDAATIMVCMAPCVSPPMGFVGGCPLCEKVIVLPSGIVSRETRRN